MDHLNIAHVCGALHRIFPNSPHEMLYGPCSTEEFSTAIANAGVLLKNNDSEVPNMTHCVLVHMITVVAHRTTSQCFVVYEGDFWRCVLFDAQKNIIYR